MVEGSGEDVKDLWGVQLVGVSCLIEMVVSTIDNLFRIESLILMPFELEQTGLK